jgi:transcriptional regulator NrdR family protein
MAQRASECPVCFKCGSENTLRVTQIRHMADNQGARVTRTCNKCGAIGMYHRVVTKDTQGMTLVEKRESKEYFRKYKLRFGNKPPRGSRKKPEVKPVEKEIKITPEAIKLLEKLENKKIKCKHS